MTHRFLKHRGRAAVAACTLLLAVGLGGCSTDLITDPDGVDNSRTIRFTPAVKSSGVPGQKKFYGYFKPRGIDLTTQYAFNKAFFLATKEMPDGKRFTNLSFPLRKPSEPDKVVGMEERSRPNAQGVTSYKGMARNSNACGKTGCTCSNRRCDHLCDH